ncbi:hypothetical protein SRHO_G00226200 [Serrasalmus rhombeus]
MFVITVSLFEPKVAPSLPSSSPQQERVKSRYLTPPPLRLICPSQRRKKDGNARADSTAPSPAHPPYPLCGPPSTQVGDQILEVNGRTFLSIPHDEAVRVLKSSRHLMMTVKDVGRLPHARTVVGETKWIASSQITESSSSSSVAG